jgi:hypothetical protein
MSEIILGGYLIFCGPIKGFFENQHTASFTLVTDNDISKPHVPTKHLTTEFNFNYTFHKAISKHSLAF